MKRRTTAIVFGAIAGSALLTGSGIALASANAGSGHKSSDSAERVKEASHGKPGTQSGQPCVKHEDDEHSDDHGTASTPSAKHGEEKGDDREHSASGTKQGERDSHPAANQSKTEKSDDGKNCVPSPGPSGAPAPSPSGAPAPSPTGAPAPGPSGTCTNTTGAAGTTASPGSGTVTVTITVCNGVITAATAVQVDNSGFSPNAAAIKTLNSLVPANYKTNIAAIHVSGATKTSDAYVVSLKSAMTKAGV